MSFIERVQKGEIDIVEHISDVLEKVKRYNEEYNHFNTISEDLALSQARALAKNPKGRLAGVAVSVKDCLVVKGVESTAGSAILNGYKPLFNATAVQKVIDEGGIIIGKTAQDEFGFGTFSTNVGVGKKIPKNPYDKRRACGGSSGGSAGISKLADFPHISLGESTGGSIVSPASLCGIYGLCPTYGRVSRYGLMDYANSLDKIGPMGSSLKDVALMQEVISGHDINDSTSLSEPVDDYTSYLDRGAKGLKIGIIKEGFSDDNIEMVNEKVMGAVKRLETKGVECEEISMPFALKKGLLSYYIIATCEASTNLAKYCGMRYGKHEQLQGGFNEYFTKVRSKNFGDEAKRRIMLGTFARMVGVRDAYYIKAMRLRTKIINEYKDAFKRFDALINPTLPFMAPTFDEINRMKVIQHYLADIMTVSANLAGLPHLSVPAGYGNNLPIGATLTADHLKEGTLIQIGSALK